MKRLSSILILIFLVQILGSKLWAQCTVQLNYPDTVEACVGENLLITASASSAFSSVLFSDTFSINGTTSPLWDSVFVGLYNNPCTPYLGNPSPQAYFWAYPPTVSFAPRWLETVGLNLTTATNVCFDYVITPQGNASPCEGPDQSNEGISVQYSIDGGVSWVDIMYLAPDGLFYPNKAAAGIVPSIVPPSLLVWENYCLTIPAVAKTNNTKIRWYQEDLSSPLMDSWGLDNLQINGSPSNYYWNVSSNDTATVNYVVTGDTIVEVIVEDYLGDSCNTNLYIEALQNSQTTLNDTFCIGDIYFLPSGNLVGLPGTYVDSFVNQFGCDSIVVTILEGEYQYASINDTFCIGTAYGLPGGGLTNVAGTYLDTINTLGACDSVITTILVGEYLYNTLNDTFCTGDSYTLPGGILVDSAGVYVDTVADISGCKTILTTNLEERTLCRTITGNAFVDFNGNCLFDGSDLYLVNKSVAAINIANSNQTYTSTDGFGNFTLNTNVQAQEVFLNNIPSLYQSVCFPDTQLANAASLVDVVNFAIQPAAWCDDLHVDIAALSLINCSSNDYVISYCNNGTLPANNSSVDVHFDDNVIVDSASIPWSTNVGNIYTFPLGNINVFDCGSFIVHTTIDCDSTFLGQVLCAEAHIYPDTICPPDTTGWSGAELQATATCVNSTTVEFALKNIGTGDMTDWTTVVAIEDIIMIIDDSTKLNVNQTQTWTIPVTGLTQRIIANQPSNHPLMSFTTDAVMLCNTSGLTIPGPIFDTTFLAYPNDEESPYIAIDCQPIVGSYDPNDKTVYPQGISENHFITGSTDLEYKIRFQNTGTATAQYVVIIDSISSLLDINSLIPGASSHAYVYDIVSSGVARFTFNNINLVDSFTNEPQSHGFVQFKISQNANNQTGDVINNTADIYFDSNPAVETNLVFNTIGGIFLDTLIYKEPVDTNTGVFNRINETIINVYPNPATDYLVFDVEENMETFEVEVYNLTGALVFKKFAQNTNKVVVDGTSLAKGVYTFNVILNKQERAYGKFVVR